MMTKDKAQQAPRTARRLTAADVRKLRIPGKYGDGNGLWLVVATAERRAWTLRYMRQGKAREMGIGSAEHMPLAEARERAAEAHRMLAKGIDPIDHRRAERIAETAEQADGVRFGQAALEYITAHSAGWRNPKHQQQWRNTLGTYAFPVIGDMPVANVATRHILDVLTPIWNSKPETASRLRGRIEIILNYATARGWRDGPNPAAWRGHLQMTLPARGKVQPVEHHAALDWREAPAFMAKLRERDSFGARALEFLIVTAARSGEVRGARWAEIDLQAAVWTVPAARMKAMRQHRVPLSGAAMRVLAAVAALRTDDAPDAFVFPGMRQKRPLSDMSLTAVLRRMGRGEITAHGFRSAFRDWAAEATDYPREAAEMALAHAVGDKVEAAYRRGDMFDKRRALMGDWAAFCNKGAPSDNHESSAP